MERQNPDDPMFDLPDLDRELEEGLRASPDEPLFPELDREAVEFDLTQPLEQDAPPEGEPRPKDEPPPEDD